MKCFALKGGYKLPFILGDLFIYRKNLKIFKPNLDLNRLIDVGQKREGESGLNI